MTAPGERAGRGEQFAHSARSDPRPPARRTPSLLEEVAAQLRTAIALQRKLLDAGDAIEPGWIELGWEAIDSCHDRLEALYPAPRPRW